jgi:AbrB family looped-hinge helix DNA binding protein
MAKQAQVVRLSSKGQVVIPAAIRRRLRLKTGQPLMIRAGAKSEVILSAFEDPSREAEALLRRIRTAARGSPGDPVEELHRRRRAERELEARRHGSRNH